MGSWFNSIHLRGVGPDEALSELRDFYVRQGWQASAPLPLAEGQAAGQGGFVVAPERDGWTPVFPGFDLDEDLLDSFVESTVAAGIHLYTIDSDWWGLRIFSGGRTHAAYDSRRGGPDDAPSIVEAALSAFGVRLDEREVGEALGVQSVYAEEGMDRLARLLGITTARNQRDYLKRGHADGLDPATLVAVELSAPEQSPGPAAARTFNVYLYSMIRRPRAGFGGRLTNFLLWARDNLNGGSWGGGASATFVSASPFNLEDYFGAGGAGTERVLTGTDEEATRAELRRLAEAAEDGRLRALTVSLDSLTVSYYGEGADSRTVQMLFFELLDENNRSASASRYAAVFDEDSPLPAMAFEGLDAYYGFVGVVPSDAPANSEELSRLLTWPPHGHWLNYLSAELAAEAGGLSDLQTSLPELRFTPHSSGALTIRLPVPPHETTGPRARRLRDALAAELASRLNS